MTSDYSRISLTPLVTLVIWVGGFVWMIVRMG